MFTPITTGVVILCCNGLYRQCDAFERNGELYAKAFGGFVRLLGGRTTTRANTHNIEVNLPTGYAFSALGKLTVPNSTY
jgi:hypothetical protein